ncbi:hypothetical protein BWP39_09730 [Paraburkholderia acidicola]|uniref:Uncharacterized protein n=1 Tax=Paraburkholderia acidicola TaxID=1912599 RepID=A0A2A4F258_9BURK|nr:hypothetical protein BWP39_09730 [Paraburkholderia acidicola]
MQTNTAPSRLPSSTRAALALIKSNVTGFDRITVWIDHPAPDVPLRRIARYCNGKPVIDGGKSLARHPMWQTRIELFQPAPAAFGILRQALGGIASKVTYAEVAIDWITRDGDDAVALQCYLLRHLHIAHLRHPVSFHAGTAYYSPRSSDQAERHHRNVALYADRPSKLWPAATTCPPCCHLEYRFSGTDACRAVGLNTVSDCAAFDHPRFWSRSLTLFDFRKTDIGRIVAPDPDVSGSMLRRHADAFLEQHAYGGDPVLQNCVVSNREIVRVLQPLDQQHFLANR